MASDKPTPPPSRETSFSAQTKQPVQPSEVEHAADAPPTASTTIHRNETELKAMSPSSVLPQSHEQKESGTANHQPSPQGGLQTTFHAPSNLSGVASNGASQPHKEEEIRRFLGIPAYQGHSYVDRSYDYMRKYPPDAPGKELDPDARVWKVYLDESESCDNDMIKSFRDTIDSLLVFAALFSSAVTGFVVQTSQALEPDYAKIGANLLFEQVQVLRAAGNATKIQEIEKSPWTPESVTHSSRDVAINWLFFASLAFSLATAFIAILIKQWLQAFTALIPGDAKRRSLIRQFRFTGLQKWKLPEIINILPLFLHLALALFLIGLCLFVSLLHPSITAMVSVVTWAATSFYIITGALPAVHLDCPYRLSILFIPACLVVNAVKMIHFKISQQLHKHKLRLGQRLSERLGVWDFNPHNPPRVSLSPLHSQEQFHVSWSSATEKLEASSLTWLFSQTPNPSVQRVAVHGVSRLLQSQTFEHLGGTGDPNVRNRAISLRDSLPLESMNQTTIGLFTPEAQLEDAPLLCDLIIASSQVCRSPLVCFWDIGDILDSPYAQTLVERDVLSHSSPDWDICFQIFSLAIEKDKWDVVMRLLNLFPDRVWDHRRDGCQVLAFASVSQTISHEDWVTIFSMAQQKGIDFNTFHFAVRSWSTVLHLVSSYGTVEALQHLLSKVPDLDYDVADCFESTPLHFACDRGKDYPKYGKLDLGAPLSILRHFAGNNKVNFKKPSPLIIQKLLSAGADPDVVDSKDYLPLHNACNNGFINFGCTEEGLKVLDELLKATTNINQRTKDGFTPLDLLEKSHRKDTEEGKAGYSLMLKHGALLAKELPRIEEGEREDAPVEGDITHAEGVTDQGEVDSAFTMTSTQGV